jgi:hypothetical protein
MLAQPVLPPTQSHKAYNTSKSAQRSVSSEKSSGTRSQCDIEPSKSACHGQADFHQEIPIRGMKQLCPFHPCGYATRKVDKMMEHMRNMHEAEGKYSTLCLCQKRKCLTNYLSDLSSRTVESQGDLQPDNVLDTQYRNDLGTHEYDFVDNNELDITDSYDDSMSFRTPLSWEGSNSDLVPYPDAFAAFNDSEASPISTPLDIYGIGDWSDQNTVSSFVQASGDFVKRMSLLNPGSRSLDPEVEEALEGVENAFFCDTNVGDMYYFSEYR